MRWGSAELHRVVQNFNDLKLRRLPRRSDPLEAFRKSTVGATTATQAQTNSRIAETVTFRDSVQGPWQAKPDTMLGSRTNERYCTELGTGRRNLARVRGSSLGHTPGPVRSHASVRRRVTGGDAPSKSATEMTVSTRIVRPSSVVKTPSP